MTGPTFTESLAVRLLARDGIAAIWQLHVAAAAAYRDGYQRAAETVLQIADAAERELLGRTRARMNDETSGGDISRPPTATHASPFGA